MDCSRLGSIGSTLKLSGLELNQGRDSEGFKGHSGNVTSGCVPSMNLSIKLKLTYFLSFLRRFYSSCISS